jgi:hypothetical protein
MFAQGAVGMVGCDGMGWDGRIFCLCNHSKHVDIEDEVIFFAFPPFSFCVGNHCRLGWM